MEFLLGLGGITVAGLVFLVYAAIAVVSTYLVGFALYHIALCFGKAVTSKDSFGKCLFGSCNSA